MDEKRLKDILIAGMDIKGVNVSKLSLLCGVQERFLEAFLNENSKDLPAAPYVRGYLIKIGGILGISGEDLWQAYKNDYETKSSGARDIFPVNRFAIKAPSKKWLIGGLIILIALIYLGVRFNDLIGKPTLKIENPSLEVMTVANERLNISGSVTPQDKLFINNEAISVNNSGAWQKEVLLQPGINTIEVVAQRFLGKETRKTLQIIYQL